MCARHSKLNQYISKKPSIHDVRMETTSFRAQDDDVVVFYLKDTINRCRRVYIGTYGFLAPVYFEGVEAEDCPIIGRIPSFILSALLRDAEDDHSCCRTYAYGGFVFWCIPVQAFRTVA